jgi:hypothetical protein
LLGAAAYARFNCCLKARVTQPWQTRSGSRLSKGTGYIYYSGKEKHDERCQKFTAIGQVVDSKPMQVEQFRGFMSWRRKIKYQKAVEVDIHPLIARLSSDIHDHLTY